MLVPRNTYLTRSLSRVVITLLSLGLLASRPGSAEPGSDKSSSFPLPPSCQLDFSGTLQWPSGRHGFLTTGRDGHFYWEDGTRARFWGINVSSTRLDIPPEQIEQVVTNFARAGLNLVRLEAIDNRNCLLGKTDAPDSQHFDRHYLDRLDRWIDALRRHGLYYYLDLLDFRTFKTGDGVLNADSMDRGARPYALFDSYLIQLQKEYATRLLTHRNPYTRLRLIDDPALVLVEICNEQGFFMTPERLETLVEPYRSALLTRWGQWLQAKYGTRQKLEAAWGKINGFPALRPEENWESHSIDLPLLIDPIASQDKNVADVRRAAVRVRDGVRFLAEVQRAYIHEMRSHLRGLGLRVPITAVVSTDIVPDITSAMQECDFTAENWYGDGIGLDARTPGVTYHSNRNPLRDDTQGGFAPYTAALRWNNKPVVIREWATTWPNRQRAASVPEALAYASFQDYDAILLFGYQTNRAPNGAEADALNDFAFQSDPTVWGLYAIAGQAFLRRALRPAVHTLTLTYPPDRQFAWPSRLSPLYCAAWCVRVNSALAGKATGPFNITPNGINHDEQSLKTILDQFGKRGAPLSGANLTTGVWHSDTEQITRYDQSGRLEVYAPTLAMVAGEFKPGQVYKIGPVRFTTPSSFGALIVFALDGLPLERSRHMVAKMVSRAENTAELLAKAPSGAPAPWVLRARGQAPVRTYGRASKQSAHLWIVASSDRGKAPDPPALSLRLDMVDGVWEMEFNDGQTTLACDTPGIRGAAQGRAFTTVGSATELSERPPDDRVRVPVMP